MTDTTRPTPRATACPDCAALVPDTPDDRRRHRQQHAHDRKVVEAFREQAKDFRRQLGEALQAVANIRRDVDGIRIPEPAEPLEISRDGWEEDPDDEVDVQEDYYDDEPDTPTLPTAPPPAGTAQDLDDDDLDHPATVYTPPRA